ncbi:MAG: lysylphosphatidylglycerol synthase transmembrane domain-containing protein [Gemmatimonadales bacterium]
MRLETRVWIPSLLSRDSRPSTLDSQLQTPLSRPLAGLLIGLGISALALWWALPADGLHSLPGYLASASPATLFLAVLVATLTFPIRALRWRLLLRAEEGVAPPMAAVWHATAIGFMANNVLPFRLGELVRGLAVSRLGGPRFPAAIASIAVERVFDALTVVGLFALILTGPAIPADLTIGGRPAVDFVRLIGLLGVGALVAAAIAGFFPAAAERVLRKLVPWPKLADKLAGPLHSFAHGLRVLHDPKRIALVVLGSVALWSVNAWSFGLAFQAFGLPGGVAASVIIQTFVVFGVALPAAPGYVGVFELAIVAAAKLFGVPDTAAFAAALTYHILTFIPVTLLGAWSLARTGLRLGELSAGGAGGPGSRVEGAAP